MNRDARNHEKENHGKGHENHENHEKESACSPSPPSSRYANSLPLSLSRYTSSSRNAIFSSNINLVHGVVSKYKIRDSYVREEAVSIGMEELWNCTERWKEEKGKFSTYAWRCVDGKVIVKNQ